MQCHLQPAAHSSTTTNTVEVINTYFYTKQILHVKQHFKFSAMKRNTVHQAEILKCNSNTLGVTTHAFLTIHSSRKTLCYHIANNMMFSKWCAVLNDPKSDQLLV